MTSISSAYLEHGSKGLTEAGKQEGWKRLGYSAGGVALAVTGVALFVFTYFCFMGVIPGIQPLGQVRVINIVFGFLLAVVGILIPVGCVVAPGVAVAANSISRLNEELSAEERTVLLMPPPTQDFGPHNDL